VMDTSDPMIEFDQKGYCNHCNNFLLNLASRTYKQGYSERLWQSYLETIKVRSKSAPYDCVVGVSGGVDSSYVALLCKEYGLRVLMVHLDNGWNSEIAARNIKQIVDRLEFDYMSVVIDWNAFRDVQLAFLRSGSVDLEMPTDIAIHASLVKTAVKKGIRYILSGGNLSSEGMLPLAWGYHRYKDMYYYRHIVNNFSRANLRNLPTLGLWQEGIYRLFNRFKVLYILNYHFYDRSIAKKRLTNELGWHDYGGKHHESRITAYWQGYVMYDKFGFDYRRPTLSAEICNGITDRASALEMLGLPPFSQDLVRNQELYVAKKFGLDVPQLKKILESPPKSYFDFPNQKALIDRLYNFYRHSFNKSIL
jgi:N-acetyl sugar amidotransferase